MYRALDRVRFCQNLTILSYQTKVRDILRSLLLVGPRQSHFHRCEQPIKLYYPKQRHTPIESTSQDLSNDTLTSCKGPAVVEKWGKHVKKPVNQLWSFVLNERVSSSCHDGFKCYPHFMYSHRAFDSCRFCALWNIPSMWTRCDKINEISQTPKPTRIVMAMVQKVATTTKFIAKTSTVGMELWFMAKPSSNFA